MVDEKLSLLCEGTGNNSLSGSLLTSLPLEQSKEALGLLVLLLL